MADTEGFKRILGALKRHLNAADRAVEYRIKALVQRIADAKKAGKPGKARDKEELYFLNEVLKAPLDATTNDFNELLANLS